MKKLFLIIVVIFSVKSSFSQSFNAGLTGGLVGSQVSGDSYAGFDKPGLTIGAYTYLPLKNEKATLGLEILFIQKGSKHYANIDKGDYRDYAIKLNYVEVPLIFTYKMPLKGLKIELGSAYSKLLDQKEIINGSLIENNPFNEDEVDLILGFKFPVSEKLDIGFRNYQTWFFTPIRDHSGGARRLLNWGQYNTAIVLSLRYNFL